MNKAKVKTKLEKILPPGINLKKGLIFYTCGVVCAFFYSLIFVVGYSIYRESLYTTFNGEKILANDGLMMPPFDELISGSMNGFIALALIMIVIIFENYAYHRRNSKSVYLMRRLPSRWERHIRCISLPLIGAAIALVMAVILYFVYFGIYMWCTPPQCLPL